MKADAYNHCPRLIEVALPIREISAESVRDKSLRHGHISTLHLWWARRPLAASRAVVFASLVPDPDDPRCPEEFRGAVERNLKTHVPAELKHYYRGRQVHRDEDPYRPYNGVPDTLRNRLLMFIAKWSPESRAFESGKRKKAPAPKELLDDRSLVKWETSDPENAQARKVLEIARKLVWTAHGLSDEEIERLSERQIERLADPKVTQSLNESISRLPVVLDPFAGGGAIPLEAGRLGCRAIANDYNPVAYLILRATCEFPQKYGRIERLSEREIERLKKEIEKKRNRQSSSLFNRSISQSPDDSIIKSLNESISQSFNPLVHDIEKWANWILERAREKIGHLYPAGKDGRPVVGYLWARTAPCSNPSCQGEIPLLRSLLVCNKKDKKVALTLDVDKTEKTVRFGIAKGKEIKVTDGTMVNRGSARCPFCDQVTSNDALVRAGQGGHMGERLVAVIIQTNGGKGYRLPEEQDLAAFEEARKLSESCERPSEPLPHFRNINLDLYGLYTWGSLFNPRQLVAMQTFVECLHEALKEIERLSEREIERLGGKDEAISQSLNESMTQAFDEYRKAVGIYLGLWLSRNAMRMTSMGRWDVGGEKFQTPFDAQAIPMKWDYPEANPFSDVTGGFSNQLDWVVHYLEHECGSRFPAQIFRGDGAHLQLEDHAADVVVTDPPYFDAIAYSDLSDFFYVWLKQALGDVIPEVLSTPLTPKGDEATALKHRHDGDAERADRHFTTKPAQVLAEAKRVMKPQGIITVMFAHQSTKAWTALINALFEAGLTVDATWPIDTELKNRAIALGTSALESSITVTCRPRVVGSAASFKQVRKEIEQVVQRSVKRFWSYGFRGADLIVACYGPAVGVFGKYERVEKADGTPVGIPELLELAKQAARDAIAGEFRGDNLSTLYYVWANLYGASEQSWDDARLVIQIGSSGDREIERLGEEKITQSLNESISQSIFVVDGSKCRLALLADRAERRGLGIDPNPPFIDALHRSMLFWKEEKRPHLVKYLAERDLLEDGPFWKLAQALFEVLPRDLEDWKLVSALLTERPTLRTEGKRTAFRDAQKELFD